MIQLYRLKLHLIPVLFGLNLLVGCSQNSEPAAKVGAVKADDKGKLEKTSSDKGNLDQGKSGKAEGDEKSPGELKGRRILTAAEVQKAPYRYIGRIVTQSYPNAIGGTAALVGRRHIVTAAHVIEDIDKLAGEEPMLFVLPDGQRSEIIKAELDGGYRKTRLTSYDLAVCTLKEPLKGGHMAWGAFEDSDFGKTMMLAGFDQDLAGSVRPPPMVVRSGRVSSQKGGYVIAALGTALLLDGARNGKPIRTAIGAGVLIEGLAFQRHHSLGWKAYFSAAQGASGGPVWLDRAGVPTVVAVQSFAFDGNKAVESFGFDKNQDKVGEFCLGSRITPGAAEAMVRDHIARTP